MTDDDRRVDYLFYGESASGRKVVCLVELKGRHYGDALWQIEQTLQRLCKHAPGKGIHTGNHLASSAANKQRRPRRSHRLPALRAIIKAACQDGGGGHRLEQYLRTPLSRRLPL